MLESADAGDEKAIIAMGLLNTMHTILAVMEERPEVHQALKPVILQVRERLHLVGLLDSSSILVDPDHMLLQAIHRIFTNSIMEFYEEAMSLSCDLATKHISPDTWKMLEVNLVFTFVSITIIVAIVVFVDALTVNLFIFYFCR